MGEAVFHFSPLLFNFHVHSHTYTHTQTHTQTFCTVSLARFSATMHFHYTCAGTRRRHFRQRQRRLKVFSLISVQFCFVLFTFLFAFLFATFYRIACQRQATGKRVTCNGQRATCNGPPGNQLAIEVGSQQSPYCKLLQLLLAYTGYVSSPRLSVCRASSNFNLGSALAPPAGSRGRHLGASCPPAYLPHLTKNQLAATARGLRRNGDGYNRLCCLTIK